MLVRRPDKVFLIARPRRACAIAGRGHVSASRWLQQEVEREDVARVIAVAPEDDVRPAVHAGRRVPVAVDAASAPRDGVDEHALVARARQRVDGEEVRPRRTGVRRSS